MTANEATIRKAYQVAENQDIGGRVNCFTDDGTFTDESIGVWSATPLSSSSHFKARTMGRWSWGA